VAFFVVGRYYPRRAHAIPKGVAIVSDGNPFPSAFAFLFFLAKLKLQEEEKPKRESHA
jgi:hypothetical protein